MIKLEGKIKKFIRSKSEGFTLIESLAVIAIIGILLALGSYLFVQARAQARDAARKSDLDQIAQAFSARYLDRTCNDQTAVGVYPGESLEQSNGQVWTKVSQLSSYSDGCGAFTKYLPTIPNDVRSPNFSYYFNLSTVEPANGGTVSALAKHYRLTTALEHQFAVGSSDQVECVRLSKIWINSFGGQPYDCDQHVISYSIDHGVLLSPVLPPPSTTQTLSTTTTSTITDTTTLTNTTTSSTLCTATVDSLGGLGGTSTCGTTGTTSGTTSSTTNTTNTTTGPYNYYIGQ